MAVVDQGRDSRSRKLQGDCGRCRGLCCVAPAFAASADFAIDKPAGLPCVHLGGDSRCGIHDDLRGEGFRGCAAFDCFGAGQQVTQVTLAGQDWRSGPDRAAPVFEAFRIVRQLYEELWVLVEAYDLLDDGPLRDEVRTLGARTEFLAAGGLEDLRRIDAGRQRREVGDILDRVSTTVRAAFADRAEEHRGADLVGARLAGRDFRGASFRGACLIGADLRGSDLRAADLLGADLRGADLRGANFRGSLFVTQPQIEAARGDQATIIPEWLRIPSHWS